MHFPGCIWACVWRPIAAIALRRTVCAGNAVDDGRERNNRWARRRLAWVGAAPAGAWIFAGHVLARDAVFVLRNPTLARRNRRRACEATLLQLLAVGARRADGQKGKRGRERALLTSPFTDRAVRASTTLPHVGVMGTIVPLQINQSSKACCCAVRGPPHVAASPFVVRVARTGATGCTVAMSGASVRTARASDFHGVVAVVTWDSHPVLERQHGHRDGGE